MLYDAVLLASDELMSKQSGRKALIVLSDGVDRGSKMTLADSIAAAQKADTMVYSILFEDRERAGAPIGGHHGMGGHGGGMGHGGGSGRMPQGGYDHPDGAKILKQLSRETGGGFFAVSEKHPIDSIYAQIDKELRSQYSLGYTPDPPARDDMFRRITVITRQKDLVVQARAGYYPKPTH